MIDKLMEQIETDQGFERFLKVILIGLVILIILLFNNVFATTTEEFISAISTENGTTTEEKKDEEEDKGIEEMGLLGGGCSTILEDDFNSYNDGNLHGQGSWSGSTVFKVQGTRVYEGAKGILFTGADGSIHSPVGSDVTDGRVVFYFYKDSNSDSSTRFDFGVLEKTKVNYIVRLTVNPDGTVQLAYIDSGWKTVKVGDFNLNAWNLVEIEWRSSDYKQRASLNGGAYTDWTQRYNSGTTYSPAAVYLDYWSMANNTIWLDYIGCEPYVEPEPELDYVSLTNLTILYFIAFMIMIMAITLFTKRKNVA